MAWIWDSPPFVGEEKDDRLTRLTKSAARREIEKARRVITELDERRDALLAELHGDSTSGTSAPPETEQP